VDEFFVSINYKMKQCITQLVLHVAFSIETGHFNPWVSLEALWPKCAWWDETGFRV